MLRLSVPGSWVTEHMFHLRDTPSSKAVFALLICSLRSNLRCKGTFQNVSILRHDLGGFPPRSVSYNGFVWSMCREGCQFPLVLRVTNVHVDFMCSDLGSRAGAASWPADRGMWGSLFTPQGHKNRKLCTVNTHNLSVQSFLFYFIFSWFLEIEFLCIALNPVLELAL